MTDKTISNRRKVGGDYFKLLNDSNFNKTLKDFIDLFDGNDYWIYKSTARQKEVTYKDFLEFKYSGYMFFKKELYSRDHINKWIEYINELGGIQYLDKPFPPFNPEEKIIIKMDNSILIESSRNGYDYFKLSRYNNRDRHKVNKTLKDFIDLFDGNDYWIYKSTGRQKEVTYKDFLEFKYSGYMFFKKELYSRDHINKWIEYINNELGGIKYLNKPFPPFNPEEKIIIKNAKL